MHHDYLNQHPSVLALLRSVLPTRPLQFLEALKVAELQVNLLLEVFQIDESPVPSEIISELPRIAVRYKEIPTSGMSYWNGDSWVICLNSHEPAARQRFTLAHEYKHVVDHGRTHHLYVGNHRHTGEEQAERAADYFAGCVLLPKRLVKRTWGEGIQRPSALARRFEVSQRAVEVRFAQLGLAYTTPRCTPPPPAPRPTSSDTEGVAA